MSILQFMHRADEILGDDHLSYAERKNRINSLRLDAMTEFKFYSPQMQELDSHIVSVLKGQSQHSQAINQQ